MTDIKYVAFDVHQATISAAVLNLEGKGDLQECGA